MNFTCRDLKKITNRPKLLASFVPKPDDQNQFNLLKDTLSRIYFYPEIRWDLCKNTGVKECATYLNAIKDMDIRAIFTFRSNDRMQTEKIYGIARRYDNLLLDVDMDQYPFISTPPQKEKLILSSHFSNELEIMGRLEEISLSGPGAIKLACPFTQSYLFEVLNMFDRNQFEPALSIVPQGVEYGYLRIVSAITVSDFVYSYLENPVVSGQSSIDVVEKIFSLIE